MVQEVRPVRTRHVSMSLIHVMFDSVSQSLVNSRSCAVTHSGSFSPIMSEVLRDEMCGVSREQLAQ